MKLLRKKQQLPPRRLNAMTHQERASESELDARYTFRRNRTLTGSLSSRVESVGEVNAELRSPRVQVHGLRRHRRRVAAILCAILLLSAGMCYLIYQSIALPRVKVDTPIAPDRAIYETKIQEYLSKRPMERYRFSVNVDDLTTYLQINGLPEVSSVSPDTDFDGLGATVFRLNMRRPVVSWKSGPNQVYVDDKGNAFNRNYYSEPTVQVVDNSGIQAKDNQVLASNRLLSFTGKVIGAMSANGFSATKVILPVDTTRQVEVVVENVNYPIKFSIDRSVGEQSEDASRAIRYIDSQAIVPQYVDVRVSGRAYYLDK